MRSRIASFFSRRWGVPARDVMVTMQPVPGGLESAVLRARVVPRRRPTHAQEVIVKQLRGEQVREGAIYRLLWRRLDSPPAARILGTQPFRGAQLLYLEQVPRSSEWPWPDVEQAARVCRALARLHDSTGVSAASLAWNYEEQLQDSARTTLALAHAVMREDGSRVWRRIGDLARVVAHLPDLRFRLLSEERTLIHGDVHPGNVMVRPGPESEAVALVDWARARFGSPLEDVASWLHSLGCWEPEARRRHDTLLREYAASRTRPLRIDRRFRELYTCAAVSNGLAGAIRYHIAVSGDRATSEPARQQSAVALAAWTRVVRRASGLARLSPAASPW